MGNVISTLNQRYFARRVGWSPRHSFLYLIGMAVHLATYHDCSTLVFLDNDDITTPGQESADVVLYGLNILLPFITPELLKVK